MNTEIKTQFDHGVLSSKTLCTQFLRELGVSRDWARVSLGEMRKMLTGYPDDKLFNAARLIVQREGDVYDRSDFECDVMDDDLGDDDSDNLPEPEAAKPEVKHDYHPPKAKPVAATMPKAVTAVATAAAEVAKPATKPEPNVAEVADLLARLMASGKQTVSAEDVQNIVAPMLTASQKEMYDGIMLGTQNLIDHAVKSMAPRELLIKTERSEVKISGLQHCKFLDLLHACSARQANGHRLNVWVYGPPGTGKTHAATNVAKALDLPFYTSGSLLTKYDITGFIAAQGNMISSPFREAWEKGGIFLFDEIDGSAPAAILSFNAALANGIMAFPDKMVDRHPDCVMIAAANTTGMGATADYNARMKLDGATMDRFVMLEWPIDEAIETALATNQEWLRIVQRVRANVIAKGIKNVCVTPRATIFGQALLETGMSMATVKQMVLRKAMSPEQWNMVAA